MARSPCHSSFSSSGDDSSSSFCGDPTAMPSCVNLSWRMLITAGLPPRNEERTCEREWMRSRGPMPKCDSWFMDGMIIITSARELATSNSLDSWWMVSKVSACGYNAVHTMPGPWASTLCFERLLRLERTFCATCAGKEKENSLSLFILLRFVTFSACCHKKMRIHCCVMEMSARCSSFSRLSGASSLLSCC